VYLRTLIKNLKINSKPLYLEFKKYIIFTKTAYLYIRVGTQESIMSQARKLFVVGALKLDDYSGLKRVYLCDSQ
ncbi:hypothetical protein, partial [Sinomicrobium oceani]|uniref:hypothetical protein n=1 Tax=Sinomicrobium oceani TaxID=1150368 RepID=UPI00227B3883